MKAAVLQPYYSTHFEDSEHCFADLCALLDECDRSMDLIVLPESCDIPAFAASSAERLESIGKYNAPILQKAAETAKRCHAIVFVNATFRTENGYRNTTYAFDRNGIPVGHYFKKHLTPGEGKRAEGDSEYSFSYSKPTVLEIEGLRFGFLTCYDFYFYEYLSVLARKHCDFIIGCSHQRSDTHDALETISKFIAYHTNTYLVRASVSMGEDSPLGGFSCIVAPTGKVLTALGSQIGIASAELDPGEKYYKPAGFGNPPAAHFEYVEAGRRPWLYRPCGSSVIRPDAELPYPRVCAHRGFNTVAPENSLPAYGAAVALGAEEIEFDLRITKDGEIVSTHDGKLERVSDGEGLIRERTYEELQKLDFGVSGSPSFRGLRILRFEEILQKFACHTIMNIHIKAPFDREYPPEQLQKIIDLLREYSCEKHAYLMCGNDSVLALAQKLAPDITRCVGAGKDPYGMVDRALRYGCKKIQLFEDQFTQEMIDRAHENGIVCNVFFADDVERAERYLDMGIDTILTNDYFPIAQAAAKRKKYHR